MDIFCWKLTSYIVLYVDNKELLCIHIIGSLVSLVYVVLRPTMRRSFLYNAFIKPFFHT